MFSSFLIGLTALVVFIIVSRAGLEASSLDGVASTTGLYVAGFFFFGLTALALGHLQAIRQRMPSEETVPVFSRRLLFTMFGVVGGIVLLGIGAASIFSAEFVALLGRVFNLAADLFQQVLSYLLIPLNYLVMGLFYAGQWLVNLFRQRQTSQYLPSANLTEIEGLPQSVTAQTVSAQAVLVMKWVFFAIVAVAVIFWLVRAVFRYRSSWAKAEIEEIHESLWSWDGFKADLRLFFSLLRQRWPGKRRKPVLAGRVPGWYSEEDQGRLGIREIYRHLLWQASRSGIARRSHETPHEYARRLGQVVPDGSEPVANLTNLYVDVRYGDVEAGDREVDDANRLWKVLKGLLLKLARG